MKKGFNAPPAAVQAGADFLRLSNGEKAVVNLLDEPVQYRQHWDEGRGRAVLCSKEETGKCAICDDPEIEDRYASVRFGVPVYVHAYNPGGGKMEPLGEVRIWEQGARVLRALVAIVEEIEEGDDWRNVSLTIKREGDRQATTYQIIPTSKRHPVPDSVETPNLEAYYLAKIQGGNGTGKTLAQMAEDPEAAPAGAPFPDPFEAE